MKSVIVCSVKGGVGKSLIAASLGIELSKRMPTVLIDADIDSFNLSEILKVEEDIKVSRDSIEIAGIADNLDFFSMGLIAKGKSVSMKTLQYVNILQDVLRRGRFNVNLKESVLVFDVPAGFSDIHRELIKMQVETLVGAVVVTQPASYNDAVRCINNLKFFGVPVIAVVENMAYFQCSQCGKKYYIFGEPTCVELAKEIDARYYQVPLSDNIRTAVELGLAEIPDELYFVSDIADEVALLEPATESILSKIGKKARKVVRENIAKAVIAALKKINTEFDLKQWVDKGYGGGVIQITITDEDKEVASLCFKLDKQKAKVVIVRSAKKVDVNVIATLDALAKIARKEITAEDAFLMGEITVFGEGATIGSLDFLTNIWSKIADEVYAKLSPIARFII